MRDALSILDQAIASGGGRLTAADVRQLVGAAPSAALEEVMLAVSKNSSDEVLRLVDRLISEGHSPVHFARQLVRFLRNAVVARIAGGESSLLQISPDERQRVVRVAEQFSEEDLARHLQIMLRTHSELGYRQEQRFHLELGLLKMVHAQRLLPIEQLLSESPTLEPGSARPAAKASALADTRPTPPANRSNFISPFAADTARKSGSKSQLSAEPAPLAPRPIASGGSVPVVLGATAPADAPRQIPSAATQPGAIPQTELNEIEKLRVTVLNSLAAAGHQALVSMLASGQWEVMGSELAVQVASSAPMIEMSLGADAKRLIIATASGGGTGKGLPGFSLRVC